MGRLVQRAQRRARRRVRRKRTAINVGWTLAVTVVTALFVYAGITAYASAKAAYIPPVSITSPAGSHAMASPQTGYGRSSGMQQYGYSGEQSSASASGQLRRCPATGCTASTCHAETGAPIPGR